jgi:hypothetical protein
VLFGLIVLLLWVCVLCVHMHAFVLSFSHLYSLVCVRLLASLLLICIVFCLHGFASSSCMANICLARIMTCNRAYTSIIKFITFVLSVGWVSSVGIATGYGVDGSGFESWWGRDFPHLSGLSLGSKQLSCAMGTGSLLGVKRGGGGAWCWLPYPHLGPRLKKE